MGKNFERETCVLGFSINSLGKVCFTKRSYLASYAQYVFIEVSCIVNVIANQMWVSRSIFLVLNSQKRNLIKIR
jgi:hypothetical protein